MPRIPRVIKNNGNVILISNLSYFPDYGGVENSIKFLAREYCNKGVQPIILTGQTKNSKFVRSEDFEGAKVFRFRFRPFRIKFFNFLFLFVTVFDLIVLLMKLKKTFNVTNSISRNQFVCYFVNLFFRDVNVYLAPGFSFNQSSKENLSYNSSKLTSLKKNVHSYFDLKAITISRKLFVFSENMKKQALQLIQSQNSDVELDIAITKPGVDKSIFSPVTSDVKDKLRLKLGLPIGDKLFLCVGRCVRAKGFDLAIEAFSTLPKDVKLVIVGDGIECESYTQSIMENNLADQVLLLGAKSNVFEYYQACDFFLMTSRYEPLGQTILEAASCALPIIAFKPNGDEINTASSELLGDVCIYVSKLSGHDLASKIEEVCNYEQDYVSDLQRSTVKIANQYSWEILSETLIS